MCEVHNYVFSTECVWPSTFKRVCSYNQLFFNVNLLYGWLTLLSIEIDEY